MYVPSHLEFLSRSGTADGWPKGIDEAGKTFAIDRVKAGLAKYTQLTLDLAKHCIYDHYIDVLPVPECLRGVSWDSASFFKMYAVTNRALLAVDARQVWIVEPK